MNIVIVHVVIYGRGTMPNFHSCSFGKQTTKATTTTKIYRHIVCRIATITTTKRIEERKYKKVTPRIQLNWWSSRLQSMNHQNAKIYNTIHGSSVALWKVFFFSLHLTRSCNQITSASGNLHNFTCSDWWANVNEKQR